jgi:SpoVK/Ycf46/Vps4 family AAA+-type ATPase
MDMLNKFTGNNFDIAPVLYGMIGTSLVTKYFNVGENPYFIMIITGIGSVLISKVKNEFNVHRDLMQITNNTNNLLVKFLKLLNLNYNTLIINNESIIYAKIISYILNNHKEYLISNNINYDLLNEINLNEIKFTNTIIEKYNKNNVEHTILFAFENNSIILRSKTLLINELEKYAKYISTKIIKSNEFTLFSPEITRTNKNGENVDLTNTTRNSTSLKNAISKISWSGIKIITNKNLHNTILSENVKNEFINDIKNFMENEIYYNTKGIPYKRGYLLYGPPGTGKTSVIKSLASNYGLDIYMINMGDIKNSSEITKIFKGFHNNGDYHIVCFEDIDRCSFLQQPTRDYYISSETNNENLNCLRTLLNELDGINEGNKRITIFTANDSSIIENIDALCRPGRIDKKIEIGHCDAKQLNDIYNHYTETNDKLELNELNEKITPANAIKTILSNNIISKEVYIKELKIDTIDDINIKPKKNNEQETFKNNKRKLDFYEDKCSKLLKILNEENKNKQQFINTLSNSTKNNNTLINKIKNNFNKNSKLEKIKNEISKKLKTSNINALKTPNINTLKIPKLITIDN